MRLRPQLALCPVHGTSEFEVEGSMMEMVGGVVGGLGLFIVGMWFLTENLKKLASRRLRQSAQRWTANRFSGLLWGALAGGVTQSMSVLTFIVVSLLRSRLVTTTGALAIILGGNIGVTALVMIVTFDIKVVSLYVLGLAGAVMVSDRLSRYRPIAASFLGGALIILGLVILKDAAAPVADQAWFRDMVEATADSLILAFAVGALLTFIVQSSSAVSVFGISLAAVAVISIDQAIMLVYGSCIGSGAVIYALSANLTGRSRQIAMYMVLYNVLICAVVVPLLYCEVYLGIPSIKALILAIDLDLDQQLAVLYFVISTFPLPFLLAGLGVSGRVLERLWPSSDVDELSRTQFIHDHARVDVDTSLTLVDLEQKRVLQMLSQYFEFVREQKDVAPLREASRTVLSEINEFLTDLQTFHPLHGVESRNVLMSRQKLLSWLEDALAAMCTALVEVADRPPLEEFQSSICEGVDSVFLVLLDALETDDRTSWMLASQLTGDRSDMMRRMRFQCLEMDPPLRQLEMINVLLITNAVEEVFFLLSKLEMDINPHSHDEV